MDLQSTFYLIGIIYMVLWIAIMILLGIVLWSIYDLVRNAPKKIEQTVSTIIESNKSKLLGMAGMAVASLITSKLKGWFQKEK